MQDSRTDHTLFEAHVQRPEDVCNVLGSCRGTGAGPSLGVESETPGNTPASENPSFRSRWESGIEHMPPKEANKEELLGPDDAVNGLLRGVIMF